MHIVGSGLMIAPVVHEGQRQREVYFPNAVWYDINGQVSSVRLTE